MSRRSRTRPRCIPTTKVRWTVPRQLSADLQVVAQVTGWSQGELATMALYRLLAYLVPAWNERAAVTIPQLRSLHWKPEPFTVRELFEELMRTWAAP